MTFDKRRADFANDEVGIPASHETPAGLIRLVFFIRLILGC